MYLTIHSTRTHVRTIAGAKEKERKEKEKKRKHKKKKEEAGTKVAGR